MNKKMASIIPVVIVFAYVGYRGLTFFRFGEYIHNAFGSQALAPGMNDCSNDQETTRTDISHDTTIASAAQQHKLAIEKGTTDNLVQNADLSHVDAGGRPLDFARNEDAARNVYQLKLESQGVAFLHVAATQDPSQKDVGSGWVMDPIAVAAGGTYRFSFLYRATSSATVTLEYDVGDQHIFRDVATLASSADWRQYMSYVTNNEFNADHIRYVVTLRQEGSLDTKSYSLDQIASAALPGGMVSVTFDDGRESTYQKAAPLLKKYGIRTTQYIVYGYTDGKHSGYMNQREIAALKSSGAEIGSHTMYHCNLTTMTSNDVAKSLRESKQRLAKLWGPVTTFAYPYGSYDDVTQKIASKTYSYIRTSDPGYNDRYFDPYNVRSRTVRSDTSEDTFRSWLAYAKMYHVWVVLVYHLVDERPDYSVTSAVLDRQLQIVRDSGLKVLPLTEAAKSIR